LAVQASIVVFAIREGQHELLCFGKNCSTKRNENLLKGRCKMTKGLYANIHAKRERIEAGSKEKMKKPGAKGAPTAADFKQSAKTAKKPKK
jgi:hypothetical protein